MKKVMAFAWATLLSVALLAAQNTEVRALRNFSGISVATGFKVTAVKGNKNEVEISANGIAMDQVMTEVKGGTLKVYRKSNGNWNSKNKYTVSMTVTYTGNLSRLQASSSGKLKVEDLIKEQRLVIKTSSSGRVAAQASVQNLEIGVSSSGSVDIDLDRAEDVSINGSSSGKINGAIDAQNITVKVSSSSTVKLEGSAKNLFAKGSSAGKVLCPELMVKNAECNVSSSAKVEVNVQNRMTGAASSGGKIMYYGNPSVQKAKTSSGGKIEKAR